MAVRVSRRKIAQFLADSLASGEPPARVAKVLAAYLCESKQTRAVELYLRDIMAELAKRHGHVAAEVVSARKLDVEVAKSLAKLIKSETDAKTVEIMDSVDSDLIGGVIVRTPDAEMDQSVRAQLIKLRSI